VEPPVEPPVDPPVEPPMVPPPVEPPIVPPPVAPLSVVPVSGTVTVPPVVPPVEAPPPEDSGFGFFFFFSRFRSGKEAAPAAVAEIAAPVTFSDFVPSPAWAVSPPPEPVAFPMPKATPNAAMTATSVIAI
jgi:hypothetical protein